jgi:hypothetical protein
MTDDTPNRPPPTREERLAAKLRENLRRRKAQARGIATETASTGAQGGQPGLSKDETGG